MSAAYDTRLKTFDAELRDRTDRMLSRGVKPNKVLWHALRAVLKFEILNWRR